MPLASRPSTATRSARPAVEQSDGHALRRPHVVFAPESRSPEVVRWEQLRRHGSFSMAYHTRQPGLRYFDSSLGHIAYARQWGCDLALADPVCDPRNRKALLREFLDARPHASFCQVTRPTAETLQSLGFKLNEIGTEFHVDLPNYTTSGRKKAHIREGANRLERGGYTLDEIPAVELCHDRLRSISDTWKRQKVVSSRETSFLSRSIVHHDEPDVRKFYLRDGEGEVVAYFHFDPIYEHGEVVGYLSNHKRHVEDLPRDFEFGVHKQLFDRFRDEGKRWISFGLSPLYEVTDEELPSNKLTGTALRLLYRYGNGRLFNFRGVAEHKRRYRGETSKVYFASQARSNAVRLLALARLCRVI